MIRFLAKVQKTSFLGHFRPDLPKFSRTRFFSENPALSLFLTHHPLTSCKKSEKTDEPILHILRYRRTDGRTDARTHGPEFIGPFRKAGVQKEIDQK